MTRGRVEGKVAMITGGARGIGGACAELLASEGATVAVTDVSESAGSALVAKITASGGKAEFWKLDVTNEHEVSDVAQRILAELGAVSVLVNNAGIAGVNKPTHEVTSEEWDHLMAVNVKDVFFCTKYIVPQMLAAKHGSIINLSSIYGIVGAPDLPVDHASKGAVRLMTKTDALFYAKQGIRVNSVHPGFIGTDLVRDLMGAQGNVEEGMKALAALHPLGHVGEPIDVAYGVLFLASDESKFVTGSELVIDGGYTAQ
jgi:NAD(P)-dependent dehydrogenase (short-subunit alcohol dehydrogenase family)